MAGYSPGGCIYTPNPNPNPVQYRKRLIDALNIGIDFRQTADGKIICPCCGKPSDLKIASLMYIDCKECDSA